MILINHKIIKKYIEEKNYPLFDVRFNDFITLGDNILGYDINLLSDCIQKINQKEYPNQEVLLSYLCIFIYRICEIDSTIEKSEYPGLTFFSQISIEDLKFIVSILQNHRYKEIFGVSHLQYGIMQYFSSDFCQTFIEFLIRFSLRYLSLKKVIDLDLLLKETGYQKNLISNYFHCLQRDYHFANLTVFNPSSEYFIAKIDK